MLQSATFAQVPCHGDVSLVLGLPHSSSDQALRQLEQKLENAKIWKNIFKSMRPEGVVLRVPLVNQTFGELKYKLYYLH